MTHRAGTDLETTSADVREQKRRAHEAYAAMARPLCPGSGKATTDGVTCPTCGSVAQRIVLDDGRRAAHHVPADWQPISSVLPHYMNDSEYQQHARVHAALEAAGFELRMVPVPGRSDGSTWPKWCRDGRVFTSDTEALALPLDATSLRKARKAARSRAI